MAAFTLFYNFEIYDIKYFYILSVQVIYKSEAIYND